MSAERIELPGYRCGYTRVRMAHGYYIVISIEILIARIVVKINARATRDSQRLSVKQAVRRSQQAGAAFDMLTRFAVERFDGRGIEAVGHISAKSLR
jgi:hypothetical protein